MNFHQAMNVFKKVLVGEANHERRLGQPLGDLGAIERRRAQFYKMTGGNGFRQEPKTPRRDAQGRTRGDLKRLSRAACNKAEHERQKSEASKIAKRTKTPVAAVRARFGCLANG